MKKRLFIHTLRSKSYDAKEFTLKNKRPIVYLTPAYSEGNEKNSHLSYSINAFEYRENLLYRHHKKDIDIGSERYPDLREKIIFELHPHDINLIKNAYILGSVEKVFMVTLGNQRVAKIQIM